MGKGGENIFLGDNAAGHYSVLNNLISIEFFKQVMVLKLKMPVTGKIVGKIFV